MKLGRLFGGRALRRETDQLNGLITSVTDLLAGMDSEHSLTSIPQELAERCQHEIRAAQAVLGSPEKKADIAAVRGARERLAMISHEVASAAFDNSTGPEFHSDSLQDGIDQMMEWGKKNLANEDR